MRIISQNKPMTDYAIGPGGSLNYQDLFSLIPLLGNVFSTKVGTECRCNNDIYAYCSIYIFRTNMYDNSAFHISFLKFLNCPFHIDLSTKLGTLFFLLFYLCEPFLSSFCSYPKPASIFHLEKSHRKKD